MQDGPQYRLQAASGTFPGEKHLAMRPEVNHRGSAQTDIELLSSGLSLANVNFRLLPNVAIASGSCLSAHCRGMQKLLRDRDIIVVGISRLGEAFVTQIDDELIGGGASVLTEAEPSAGTLNADDGAVTLALSRSALATLAPDFAAAIGRSIPAEDPALRLLGRYLDAVLAADELAEPQIAHAVAAHILDLVGLALGARGNRSEATSGGAKAARLKALKSDVISMLGNSELSSELIAGRHSISSRYVRKLFEQEGMSFTTFVLGERLARVRRMLCDPRHANLTIAQLAHACGFNDISYFNRAFRRHFGATPTDVREERQEDGLRPVISPSP